MASGNLRFRATLALYHSAHAGECARSCRPSSRGPPGCASGQHNREGHRLRQQPPLPSSKDEGLLSIRNVGGRGCATGWQPAAATRATA